MQEEIKKEKMKISWCQGMQDWAFKHLCQHLRRQMPNQEHAINEPKGDVLLLVCPSQLDKFPERHNIIQHIDSNRWYEKQIE